MMFTPGLLGDEVWPPLSYVWENPDRVEVGEATGARATLPMMEWFHELLGANTWGWPDLIMLGGSQGRSGRLGSFDPHLFMTWIAPIVGT